MLSLRINIGVLLSSIKRNLIEALSTLSRMRSKKKDASSRIVSISHNKKMDLEKKNFLR